jgi:glutamate synthase domain-containing protein 2
MMEQATTVLGFFAYTFIAVVGLVLLIALVMFVVDVTQTEHAVRRNFPVIGRFRYLFEGLGGYMRQYFIALDREELPFNRAERSWVYRAAKGVDSTVAFGSTRDLHVPGTVLFANSAFPVLDTEALEPAAVTIGPRCEHAYTTRSLFNVSAMSYGAISKPAVQALARGAARAGIWINTGEGGLAPYHLEGGGDIVFQIGTAKYGVRDAAGLLSEARLAELAALPQIKLFELKLSQGAKPGKGGILPAIKVTPEIAKIRGIPVGYDSISPNRHLEAGNVEELLDLVHRIRDVSGKPTGLKYVVGSRDWLDDLCLAIWARGTASAPDFLTIDSGDGGTGAAPMPLMDNVGLPLRESLPLTVDQLNHYGLRERIKVIASGKLVTPADAAWAYCVGADFVSSARGFMLSLGCIQALQCNLNTCPTGITTHRKRLQRGLDPADKSERVKRYALEMHKGIAMLAHSCGVVEPRALRRHHCRVVTDGRRSASLTELHPDVQPAPEFAGGANTGSVFEQKAP